MRKSLLTGLFCVLIISCSELSGLCLENVKIQEESNDTQTVLQDKNNPAELKTAIDAYKDGNFLECISILQEYIRKDDKNAIAWYYLGNSYMNIAMVKEANEAFDKAISLNTINYSPRITSYAIQAQLCMQSDKKCKYEDFNVSEVKKLKTNPTQFINDYYESINKKNIKSDDIIQIENLIKGAYVNNIHPDAQAFILEQHTKMETDKINSGGK